MSSDDDLQPRFHRGLTLFLALLVSMSVCFTGSQTVLRRALVFEHPARTAREHFEKAIELEDALRTEPEWLRRTTTLFLGRVRPALSEAIDAYAEVIAIQARALRSDAANATGASEAPVQGQPGGEPADPPPASDPADEGADTPTGTAQSSSSGATGTTPDPEAGEDATAPRQPAGGFGCSPDTLQPEPKDSHEELCELLARIAIMQGEAERIDDVRLTVARLENLGEKALAHAIGSAYQELEPLTQPRFDEFDLTRLSPGWARERLELRLARTTGDTERVRSIEGSISARSRGLVTMATTGAWSLLVPVLVGLVALLVWLLRNRPALPQSGAAIPPEWSFEDGFAVLLRSVVLGIGAIALVWLAAKELAPAFGPLLITLIAPLPMLILVHRGLIRPRALSFLRVLGLDALPGGAWKWIGIVLALFAADQLGQALILELCGRVGVSLHWTELVDEQLLRSSNLVFAVFFVLAITWEPVVREVLSRGLVFLTLRQRMPAATASLWSAALIAAFHNASLPSFLVLVWSGFLYARTFEATRSILPAIAVQVLAYAGTYGAFAAFCR